MDRPEQLEQQIWELVYGLLPADEADAIREQITSDPDVARLYADVKLQSELVADATRLEVAPIPLQTPRDSRALPEGEGRRLPTSAAPAGAERSAVRTLRWAVTLAATLLVGFIVYAYLKPQSPLRPVAFRAQRAALDVAPVQATVLGPGRLQSRPANHLAVITRSLSGQPRSTKVAYRFYDEADGLLVADQSQTGTNGILQIETPAEIDSKLVRLEVETLDGLNASPVTHTFAVDPAGLITHLNLDKPLCRPGETVRYRTVTLSRYDLRVREEVPVTIEIQDPDGNVLPGSVDEGLTERGVRHGGYPIPADLPGGKYDVVARSPDEQFAEIRRGLFVRHYVAPRYRKQLDFARESYGPGDEVAARFSVERAEGGSLPGAPLQVRATVDGTTMLNQNVSTDQQGTADVAFSLPRELKRGEGSLTITVGEDAAEVLSKSIPIHLGRLHVDFFPESGDLVAGVENRVYFRARDDEGKPVHMAGHIVDQMDKLETTLRTERDGRGVFSLVPVDSATYRLKIGTPAGTDVEPVLPAANPARFVVLDAGPGVFESAADLAMELRSTDVSRPLAITASCRGAVVGQQIVTSDRFATREDEPATGVCSIALPVAEHAEGVIRLTAYDLGGQPALPVAERLVYRQPRQRLEFEFADIQPQYTVGDQVDLTVQVHNEANGAEPAVLGLSVVDDSLLTLADDHSAGLTTHFRLTGQIPDARLLEDADFYLDPERPEAARALDLLLGTQGWRRLAAPAPAQLAQRYDDRLLSAANGLPTTRQIAVDEAAAPVVLANNASEVRTLAEMAVTTLVATRELDLRRIGLTVLLGSLLLLVVTLISSLIRPAGGLRRWAPHLATASICLILGVFWISARIDTQGRLTWSDRTMPSTDRQVAERGVAIQEQLLMEERQDASNDVQPLGFGQQIAEDSSASFGDDLRHENAPDESPPEDSTEQRLLSEHSWSMNGEFADRESLDRDGKMRFGRPVADEEMPPAEMEEAAEAHTRSELAAQQIRGGAMKVEQIDSEPSVAEHDEVGQPALGLRTSAAPAPEAPTPAAPPHEAVEPGAPAPDALEPAAPAPAAPAPGAAFRRAPGGEKKAIGEPAAELPLPASEPAPAAPAETAVEPAPARPSRTIERGVRAVDTPAADPASRDSAVASGDLAAGPPTDRPMAAAKPGSLDKLAENLAEKDRDAGTSGAIDSAKSESEEVQRRLADTRMQRERIESEPQPQFGGGFGGGAQPATVPLAIAPSMEDDRANYRFKPRDAKSDRGRAAGLAAPLVTNGASLPAPLVTRQYALWDPYAAPGETDSFEAADGTRYWNPLAVADEQGRFQFRFTLPNVQTTYRISVDGHLNGRIGSKQAEIIARELAP